MAGLIVAMVIGILALVACEIWIALIASRESNSKGVLCLVVPFYAVYYAITRWTEAKKPFIIGLAGLILFIGGSVPLFTQLGSEVEPVITEFMEAGVAKDIDRAYACCHSSVSKEEVANFILTSRDLFEGFEDVTTSSFSVHSSAGITTAESSGAIIYSGDRRLSFEASLVKENDIWRITGFEIGY